MSHRTNSNQMAWLNRFALGRPVIFSVLVFIVSSLLTEIPFDQLFLPWLGDPAATFCKVILGHTLTGLGILWLIVKLGLLEQTRFTRLRQWKAVWLVWPFLGFILLNLLDVIEGNTVIDTSRPGLIVLLVILNLAIGFCEEVLARGLVLSVIMNKWGHTRRGIYSSVLVASSLFGIIHISNAISGHLPWMSSLAQIAYGFFFGVAMSACFLRNNSIWPMMIVHAAIDFGSSLRHIAVGVENQAAPNSTLAQVVTTLIITLPLFIYGLVILRRVSPLERLDHQKLLVIQTSNTVDSVAT